MAFLLLIGGVESNLGPTRMNSTINMGLVNARSEVNKSALIHDMINENRLDLLAVTDTWVYEDSPNVHKRESCRPSYCVVHAHRDSLSKAGKRQNGGGVALIHREDICVKVIPTTHARPVTFELLLAKVMNSTLSMKLAIIYRPPNPTSKPCDFTNELSELIDSGSLGSCFIICGDLNCPGPVGSKRLVGKELSELIDGYNLTQHVKDPTHRSGYILHHILSSSAGVMIHDVTIDDVGFSDHSLIRCKVDMDIKRQPIVRASFRNWKKLNLDTFKQRIRLSSAFTEPATTAEEFAGQLETDIQ